MFFQDPRTPKEAVLSVIARISKEEQVRARRICKNVRDRIDASGLIWGASGAKDYEDFFRRVRKLGPKARGLVLSNPQYNLSTAEEIERMLASSQQERVSSLLSADQMAAFPNNPNAWSIANRYVTHSYVSALTDDNGVIALCEGLITPELAAALSLDRLNILLSDNGILALRKRLITSEHVIAMPLEYVESLKLLTTDNGFIAWSEGLITLEQATDTPHDTLKFLLENKDGITVLRDKLITITHIRIYPGIIHLLETDDGILALRQKLITRPEASGMFTRLSFDDAMRVIEGKLLSAGLKKLKQPEEESSSSEQRDYEQGQDVCRLM